MSLRTSILSTMALGVGAALFAACGSQASTFATSDGTGSDTHPGAGGATTTPTSGEGGGVQISGAGGHAAGCTTNADCNDGDACTEDTCVGAGQGEAELGTCAHTSVPGCGTTSSSASASSSSSSGTSSASSSSSSSGLFEQMCPAGCASGAASYPPAVPLLPPGLPASCSGGFELNSDSNVVPSGKFTATAISPSGSGATTLDIQIATYTAPDHLVITGVDASNKTYTLVDTCSMKTANYADPTNGCARPPDDSIRQYQVTLKAGTKSLTFDVGGGCTPNYLRVLGLCEFTIAAPATAPSCRYRPIP